MESELLDAMTETQCSAKEAAKLFNIPDGRLQAWMNRGFMQFKSIEQGPRRILRRFDGHDLLMLGAMVSLMNDYGIDVSDAHHIASGMHSSASLLLMEADMGKGVQAIPPNYYIITDNKVQPCFGVDTVQEARDRVGTNFFSVFNASPAICKSLVVVLRWIGKEATAELESAELESTA